MIHSVVYIFKKGSFWADRPSFFPTLHYKNWCSGPARCILLSPWRHQPQANKVCSFFFFFLGWTESIRSFSSTDLFLTLGEKPWGGLPGGSSLTRTLPLLQAFFQLPFPSFLDLPRVTPLSKLTMAELWLLYNLKTSPHLGPWFPAAFLPHEWRVLSPLMYTNLYIKLLRPVPKTLSHILIWPTGTLPLKFPCTLLLYTHLLFPHTPSPQSTFHSLPSFPSLISEAHPTHLRSKLLSLSLIQKVQLRSGNFSLLRDRLSPAQNKKMVLVCKITDYFKLFQVCHRRILSALWHQTGCCQGGQKQ